MTAFFGGLIFGAILMAGIAAAIFTRFQRPRELEQWEDPFSEPPPIEANTTTRKRIYEL